MPEIKNFVNPNALPDVQCISVDCGSIHYIQQFRIKKVSKFQSENGQSGFIVVPVFVCVKCGCEIILSE